MAQQVAQKRSFKFFSRGGEDMVWCKDSEEDFLDLEGKALYGGQVPISRAVFLWGRMWPDGASIIVLHKRKKIDR